MGLLRDLANYAAKNMIIQDAFEKGAAGEAPPQYPDGKPENQAEVSAAWEKGRDTSLARKGAGIILKKMK